MVRGARREQRSPPSGCPHALGHGDACSDGHMCDSLPRLRRHHRILLEVVDQHLGGHGVAVVRLGAHRVVLPQPKQAHGTGLSDAHVHVLSGCAGARMPAPPARSRACAGAPRPSSCSRHPALRRRTRSAACSWACTAASPPAHVRSVTRAMSGDFHPPRGTDARRVGCHRPWASRAGSILLASGPRRPAASSGHCG